MRRDHVLQFVLEAAQTPDFQGVTAQAVADALSIWRNDAALAYDPAQVQALRDRIYAMVVQDFAGSYSAEHGIGPHNLAYYQQYTPAPVRQLAQGVRQLMDPEQLCGTVDFGLNATVH